MCGVDEIKCSIDQVALGYLATLACTRHWGSNQRIKPPYRGSAGIVDTFLQSACNNTTGEVDEGELAPPTRSTHQADHSDPSGQAVHCQDESKRRSHIIPIVMALNIFNKEIEAFYRSSRGACFSDR